MAATTPSPEETIRECAQCGGDRRESTSVAGSFCSTSCHRDHKRSKRAGEILEAIEHDHRFCRTCFAQLKETNKPPRTVVIGPCRHQEWDNAKDVLVGYQYRLEAGNTGEISRDVDDEAERPIVEDAVMTGTICECGATDHRDADPTIRETIPGARLREQLANAARVLGSEEKHDVDYDGDQLVEASGADDVRGGLEGAVILDE